MKLLNFLTCLTIVRAYTVVQLSDIHYSPQYREGSMATCFIGTSTGLRCCHSWDIGIDPYLKAGYWGDYGCDTPYSLVNYTVNWIRNNINPDLIMWTGDTVGHNDITQTFNANMKAVQDITDLLHDFDVIPVVGNHDTWPIDQLPFPKAKVLSHLAESWKHWLANSSYTTFMEGGYYSQLIWPGLRAMVLNCLYDDTNNKFDLGKDVGQHSWAEKQLAMAQKNGEKVWLIGHIYPGGSESSHNFTDTFIELMSKYHNTVVNQFWGHSHKDEFNLYQDSAGNFVSHSFVVPSVEPDNHLPSFRVYQVDQVDDLTITNYQQYTVDLDRLNAGEMVDYEIYYDAVIDYGMTDMSTDSWYNLTVRMESNDTLFQLWYNHTKPGGYVKPCTESCKTRYICDIRYIHDQDRQNCQKK